MSSHGYVQRDSPSPTSELTYCSFPSIPIFGDKRDHGNFPRLLATPAIGQQTETSKPDVTIDMLPDTALLNIFDSYEKPKTIFDLKWDWRTLLRVCRRWRHIILTSPRRLDLRIFCGPRTPMRKLPDFWPPVPISVSCFPWAGTDAGCKDNILAALEHRDRVFEINLMFAPGDQLQQIASTMVEPFPILTRLYVYPNKMDIDMGIDMPQDARLALPDAFLGGSAPRLREIILEGTAFPALPNLVLSASHFHKLHLSDVPHAGYIPPQTMVTFLLALPNLKSFAIGFASPQSRPLQISPAPLTRAVLPSLTNFGFHGASEYLVDFIAQIDTPLLDSLQMTFFSDLVFDIPRLYEFLGRLKPFVRAELRFGSCDVVVSLRSSSTFWMDITCKEPDWPLESMTRLCVQLAPLLSQVECLEIDGEDWDALYFLDEEGPGWQETVDDPNWLELFSPFVSVKSLYMSERPWYCVEEVLEKVTGERVIEVLPALQNLFTRGIWSSEAVEKALPTFVSARQLYDHPVVVQRWELPPRQSLDYLLRVLPL